MEEASIRPKLSSCSSSPVRILVVMRVPASRSMALHEGVIVFAGRAAIGEDQQIMAGDTDAMADRLLPLQLFHHLRNAVNQDVLVVDGRQALDARDDLQPIAVMLISANRGFRFLRKRVERMLHLRNEILEHRIGDIADEQIAIAVLRRAEVVHPDSGF